MGLNSSKKEQSDSNSPHPALLAFAVFASAGFIAFVIAFGVTSQWWIQNPNIDEMRKIAMVNFDAWNKALKTKNDATVANMYASSDISFLPTVSPNFIRDNADAKMYFTDFLKKEPEGTITSHEVQPFSPDSYLHSGMYTFMVGPASARSAVKARFSYVWKKIDGTWKIIHHHSSVLPGSDLMTQDDLTSAADKNFKAWNDALQTGNKDTVAAMYTTSVSFLPTVSPNHIKNTPGVVDYFADFLKKKPFGTITDQEVMAAGSSSYLHSGLYTFDLEDAGVKQKVAARFSYLWTKVGDAWKIAHHHSSVVPGGSEPVLTEAMVRQAQTNFNAWNEALKTKDKTKVADMYVSDDLSFLPTVEPKMLSSRPETLGYFDTFLKKSPSGVLSQDKVHMCGSDGFVHSGIYDFATTDANNAKVTVNARFSYLWKKVGNDWKIFHHHSSKVPIS